MSYLTFTFTPVVQYDTQYETITNYAWSFGDGNTTDMNVPTPVAHTYAADGTYVVNCTVTTSRGRSANGQTSVSPVDPNPPPPAGHDILAFLKVYHVATQGGITNPFSAGTDLYNQWEFLSTEDPGWAMVEFYIENKATNSSPITAIVSPVDFGLSPTSYPTSQPLGPTWSVSTAVQNGTVTIYVPDWDYNINMSGFNYPEFSTGDGVYPAQILFEGTSQGATTMEITLGVGAHFRAIAFFDYVNMMGGTPLDPGVWEFADEILANAGTVTVTGWTENNPGDNNYTVAEGNGYF